MKKILAVGLIAAGLVIGTSTAAHAITASPYVTVLWSYDGYPDLTQPQAFVNSAPGADLHAFDATLAQGDSCGHAFQVDAYKVADEHGRSWETLKSPVGLQYAHDGGFLAYDAGIGTPYRVITPEEYPCTTPTPEPSPTTTPSSPEPSASATPSSSSSPEPSDSPTVTPSAEPTVTPTPPSGEPSAPTSSAPVPTPSSTTSPTPSAGASSTPAPTSSPTATGTPSPSASAPSSTPSATTSTPAPPATGSTTAGSSSARKLAYTGVNPWPGIGAASVLIAAGMVLLTLRRVRRG